MPTDFNDPETARRLRDVVDRLVLEAIDEQRPRDVYGTVTAIDNDGRRVWVQFGGAPSAVPVIVGGIQPTQIGQVVRVSTIRPGTMVVVDVNGTAALTGETSDDLPAVAGLAVNASFDSLYVTWTDNAAPKYEVQVADDSGFTTNVRSYITQSTQISIGGLLEESTYYVRVRSINESQSSFGAWSSTESDTTSFVPGALDGNPPDSSPTPTVTGGIGMVTAEWVAATGTTDIVTYEVHVSLTTGFTPSAATLLDETTSRFAVITQLPDGTPLTDYYETNIFVRLIAKDGDGSAAVGAQGFAQPRTVETGDVGTVDLGQVRDGSAPSSSPTAVITEGAGYLLVTWLPVTNADPVDYEIHISTTSGFTPNENTLSVTTPSTWAFIRNESPQINISEPPLDDATTYYVRIVATDADGSAAAGTEDSGSPLDPLSIDNTNTATYIIDEIVAAEITIGDANIVDGKITNLTAAQANIWRANIQDLAVDTAQINDLAVSTAKIASLAVQEAQIDNLAVTNGKIADLDVSKLNAGTINVAVTLSAATITGGSMTIGTGNNVMKVETDGDTYWGHTDPLFAPALIQNDGDAYFNSIQIDNGSGGTELHMTAGGYFWIGDSDFATADFRVWPNGSMHALNGNFTGSITASTITGGSINIASGTFEVDASGNLTATSATIAGDITAEMGSTISGDYIDGGTITGTSLNIGGGVFQVSSGGVLTASSGTFSGTVSSGTISASTFTGGSINIGSGNFVVSSGGGMTSTSATITGGTLDIGGADTTSFHVDSGGNMWMGAASFATNNPFRVTAAGVCSAAQFELRNSTTGTLVSEMGYTSSGGPGVETYSGNQLALYGASGVEMDTGSSSFDLECGTFNYQYSGTFTSITTGAAGYIELNSGDHIYTDPASGHSVYNRTDTDGALILRETSVTATPTKYLRFEQSTGGVVGAVGLTTGDAFLATNYSSSWYGIIVNRTTGDIRPWGNAREDIGTSAFRWGTVFASLTDSTLNQLAVNKNSSTHRIQFNSSTIKNKTDLRLWTPPSGSHLEALSAIGPQRYMKTIKVPKKHRNPEIVLAEGEDPLEDESGEMVGLIAEMVEEHLGPEAAVYDEDGEILGYADSALLASIVGAIGEINAKLQELESA